MKTYRIFIILIILLIVFLGCSKEEKQTEEKTYCQQLKELGIVDDYQYPVVPGTPEWEELESRAERIEACQVPDSILTNICTYGLIVTCLNYPYRVDLIGSEIVQISYDIQKMSFNGLAELHQRPDALFELAEYYDNYDLTEVKELWDQDNTFNAIDLRMTFYNLGIIIYQYDIIGQSDSKLRQELIKIALEKYDYMIGIEYVSWWHAYYANATIMGRIMLMENFSPFKKAISDDPYLGQLIETGCNWASSEQIKTIADYARQFIND